MDSKKEKIDVWVGNVLLIGSYAAALLLLVGLFMLLLSDQTTAARLESKPLSFSGLLSHLKDRSPLTLLNLGILVMMLTPLLRVLTAGFSFLLEKDYKYLLIASGVLIILLANIISIFI
jgi:uncharacterized membrane protein